MSETAAVCRQKTTAGAVTTAPAVHAIHAAHVAHAPHAADAAATTTLNRAGRDATLPAPPILPLQQGAIMSNNGRAGVLLYELLAISQWVCVSVSMLPESPSPCRWADLVSAHFVRARHSRRLSPSSWAAQSAPS